MHGLCPNDKQNQQESAGRRCVPAEIDVLMLAKLLTSKQRQCIGENCAAFLGTEITMKKLLRLELDLPRKVLPLFQSQSHFPPGAHRLCGILGIFVNRARRCFTPRSISPVSSTNSRYSNVGQRNNAAVRC